MLTQILNSASVALAEQMERDTYYEAIDFLCSNMSKYLDADQALGLALERSVPHTVLFDAISIWPDRDPYTMFTGATELPYGYWSDLLAFPLRERKGVQEAMVSKKWLICANIPLLTVERKVLGIIGEKQIVCCGDLKNKLTESLIDIGKQTNNRQRYAYEEISTDHYSVICSIHRGHSTQIKVTDGLYSSLRFSGIR